MPKKAAPKTEKVVNTNVYYDEIREDYGRINAVLQAQITKLRRLIERMPLQMRLDLETTNPIAPVYDGYAVINIVNPAIKALHKNLRDITGREWEQLNEWYAAIPKGRVEDGKYVSTGEIRTTIDPECVEMLKEIARYVMTDVQENYGVKIPYVSEVGSPKILGTIAVLYTARIYLPLVEDLL